MKKFVIILILFSLPTITSAQSQRCDLSKYKDISIKRCWSDMFKPENNLISPRTDSSKYLTETLLGESLYYLQSPLNPGHRFHHYLDDYKAAIWTISDEYPGFNDAGTAYVYKEGDEWSPSPENRLESQRTFFPSYDQYSTFGEIITSQGANGLVIMIRDLKQQGIPWQEIDYPGPTGFEDLCCPKVVTSGHHQDIIHLIATTKDTSMGGNFFSGQNGALLYSRSQDGCTSWDIQNVLIPELEYNNYTGITTDSYVWAETDHHTIAFVVGSPWMDLAVMRSFDDGETWNKTIIWEHPYPMFDWNTITDTFYCPDGSFDIFLDHSDKAHVVFGIGRVLHNTPGDTFEIFPYTDGIAYWNDDMPPFTTDNNSLDPNGTELVEDYNLIGWAQDVDGSGTLTFTDINPYNTFGLSTMPSIQSNYNDSYGSGFILLFAGTTETYVGYDNYNYKHIWFRDSDNGSWPDYFVDLNPDIIHIFDDCIYPNISPYSVSSGTFDMIYNTKTYPGPQPGILDFNKIINVYDEDWWYTGWREYDCNPSFLSSNTIVNKGDTVWFTGGSSHPTYLWHWEFEGGEPAESYNSHVYAVYNTIGKFDVALHVVCPLTGTTGTISLNHIQVVNGVGICDNEMNASINISPNPFSDIINIAIENDIIEEIEIRDVLSKKTLLNLAGNASKNQQINTSSLNSGLYIVEVRGKKTTYFKKIVKN